MISSSDFRNCGFVRVIAASPAVQVADIPYNLHQLKELLVLAHRQKADLIVFPELAITSYSIADLLYQETLRREAEHALIEFAESTTNLALLAVVGCPLQVHGRLYNCAVACANGEILAVIPKSFLPNTGEYYEQRWFSPAEANSSSSIVIGNKEYPFGTDVLLSLNLDDNLRCAVGIEICEDVWSVIPPSSYQAIAGAEILLNLSASNEVLGKASYRTMLVTGHSAKTLSAYIYASAGAGESTTDTVFSGHSLIAENGSLLAESQRCSFQSEWIIADIDVNKLQHERLKNSSFSASKPPFPFRKIRVELCKINNYDNLERRINPSLYPAEPHLRDEYCREVFRLQTVGLAKRLRHIGAQAAVIGISGGLDSTLALLAVIKAFDTNGWDRSGIHAITMPGYGTGDRTRSNALQLMEKLGVSHRTIPIHDAVAIHFRDIGHNPELHDITYENSQARERTQVLMDIANQVRGIVIGTGDLSELALGWCTYAGDHISMYNVNGDVPKTLVQYVVQWCAHQQEFQSVSEILLDILATPVSPELLPATEGKVQSTEDTLGPYIIHDFFLYYAIRYGASPLKVFFMAQQAFAGEYSNAEIIRYMHIFYTRFFAHQFKRSCLPDGPKVGSLDLSPRASWRMPSDAKATIWLQELRYVEQHYATQQA